MYVDGTFNKERALEGAFSGVKLREGSLTALSRMVNSEITIVDNTGLLDPRVRRLLALAGEMAIYCLLQSNITSSECVKVLMEAAYKATQRS